MKKINFATEFTGIEAAGTALKKVCESLNIEFENLFGCEIDEDARNTILFNHNVKELFKDINYIDVNRDLLKYRYLLDIMTVTPPCQGLSQAGKGKGYDDERSGLFYVSVEHIRFLQPKVVVFENVPALTYKQHREDFEITKRELEESGYVVSFQIMDSSDYNSPQQRKRLIGIFIRKDLYEQGLRIEFPEKSKENSPCIKDIYDSLENIYKECNFLEDYQVRSYHQKSSKGKTIKSHQEYEKHLNKINNYNSVVKNFQKKINDDEVTWTLKKPRFVVKDYHQKSYRTNFLNDSSIYLSENIICTYESDRRVLNENFKSSTLTCRKDSCRVYDSRINKVRTLTRLEKVRLSGFPDDYRFPVSDTKVHKLLGNTVVVNIFESVFKNVVESLMEFNSTPSVIKSLEQDIREEVKVS